MTGENLFSEVGGQLVEKVFSGILWFGIGFIIFAAIGGVMWYFVFYQRKFDIKVKIISERAGDKTSIIFDKAAILTDRKSKIKYFRLWGLRKDLPVPSFNVLQLSGKGDYLELYRRGEDELYFLSPSTVSKTKVIKENGKVYGIAEQESIRMDIDLNYWAAKRRADNKSMFDMDSLLMKLLPYMPAVFTGVLMMFILYILLDHLPGILAQIQELYRLQVNVCKAGVVAG